MLFEYEGRVSHCWWHCTLLTFHRSYATGVPIQCGGDSQGTPMSEMIIPGDTCVSSHLTQGIVEGHDRPLCDGNVVVARVVLNPAQDTLPLK